MGLKLAVAILNNLNAVIMAFESLLKLWGLLRARDTALLVFQSLLLCSGQALNGIGLIIR